MTCGQQCPPGAKRRSPPENRHLLRKRSNSLRTDHRPQENRGYGSEDLRGIYHPPSININGHQLNVVAYSPTSEASHTLMPLHRMM